jgi:predicted transcriptional regulator
MEKFEIFLVKYGRNINNNSNIPLTQRRIYVQYLYMRGMMTINV